MKQESLEMVKKANKKGVLCAWALLAVVVLQLVVWFLFSFEGLMMSATIIVGVIILGYLYYEFLKGFVPISLKTGDLKFQSNVNLFIKIMILSCLALISIEVAKVIFELASTSLFMVTANIVVYFVLGIVSLKISKSFTDNKQELGVCAEQAALYHKVAGWLLVTVILGFVGILASLIADYYMWKVQQSVIRRQIPAPASS
jgi:hypothetical protein